MILVLPKRPKFFITLIRVISRKENKFLKVYLNKNLDYTRYSYAIYDPFGIMVRQGKFKEDSFEWEGIDGQGRSCYRGVYLVMVNGPEIQNTFKVVMEQ